MLSLPAISIENLLKRFEDVTAVDGISLQVPEGELFGLLGPNGAGKTTVINVLCGLIQPTKGSCRVGGYDTQKETAKVKDLIGVCPQARAPGCASRLGCGFYILCGGTRSRHSAVRKILQNLSSVVSQGQELERTLGQIRDRDNLPRLLLIAST
jgi:ABC-2 type transport system ATP-binding protein